MEQLCPFGMDGNVRSRLLRLGLGWMLSNLQSRAEELCAY